MSQGNGFKTKSWDEAVLTARQCEKFVLQLLLPQNVGHFQLVSLSLADAQAHLVEFDCFENAGFFDDKLPTNSVSRPFDLCGAVKKHP